MPTRVTLVTLMILKVDYLPGIQNEVIQHALYATEYYQSTLSLK